jgi:hypothetical protein
MSDLTNKLTFISFSVGAGRWWKEGVVSLAINKTVVKFAKK